MSATNVLLRKNEDTPTLDVYKRKGGAFTAPRSPKQTELEKAYGMNPDGTLKASAGTTPATAEKVPATVEKVPATVEKAPTPSAAQEAYDSGMAELERAYGEGVKKQDQLRADSRRDATAVYERMSRYLPRAQMAMGTAGTGMAESDRIAAYNNYTGQLAAANRTHADNVAALGEAKASGEAKLKQELITGQQDEKKDADNLTLDVYKQMATDAMADGKLTEAELAALNEYATANPMQTENGKSVMARLQQMYGAKVTPDGQMTEAEKKDSDELTLSVYERMVDNALSDGKLTEAELAALNEYAAANPMHTTAGQSTMERLQQMYGARVTKDGELTETEKAGLASYYLDTFMSKRDEYMGDDGKYSQAGYDAMVKWLADNDANLTEYTKRTIQADLNEMKGMIRTYEEQAKADAEAQTEKDGGAVRAGVNYSRGFVGSDGEFYAQFIDSQGNTYTVPQMMKCKDERVVELADSIAKTNEVFMYDNELYVKRADGNTYKLGGRSDFGAKEQVHYKQLVAYFRQYANGKINLPSSDAATGKATFGTDAARDEKFK